MSWLDPTTPQGMQFAGLLGGLNALGAGLLQAGAPRPVGQPGPTLGDAFGAFGQGQRAGLANAKAQRDMRAMQMFGEALSPDTDPAKLSPSGMALRNAVPENMRAVIGALPSDMQAQTVAQIMTQKTNPKDRFLTVGRHVYDVSSGSPQMVAEAPDTVSAERHAQNLRERAAGAARVITNLPPTEAAFDREYGKGLSDMALGVLRGADKANDKLATLAQLEALLPEVKAGKFGPAMMTLSAFGQAIGMSPETLTRFGLPASATPAEMFDMLTTKLTAANIGGEGGVPAANFSNTDLAFVKRMEVDLSRRPETIALRLAAGRKIAERQIEAAESWNAARANNVPFDKWQAEWKRYVNANPLFGGSEWRVAPAQGMATPARGGVQAEPPPNPAVPPPAQRRIGQVYDSPRGPVRWMGNGWEPVQ